MLVLTITTIHLLRIMQKTVRIGPRAELAISLTIAMTHCQHCRQILKAMLRDFSQERLTLFHCTCISIFRYELNGDNENEVSKNNSGKKLKNREIGTDTGDNTCDCQNNGSLDDVGMDLVEIEAAEADDLDDTQCSLVTVLASDGYTCITSPVISNRSDGSGRSCDSVSKQTTTTIRCSGVDSGLSSEDGSDPRHLSSASSSSHDEMTTTKNGHHSDKSSDVDLELRPASEAVDRLNESAEDMGTYAERNVLHEEATTVEAETITVDRFRQRFGGGSNADNTNSIGGSRSSLANGGQNSFDAQILGSNPGGGTPYGAGSKYKAPPPPPRQRRTSSSSSTIKVRA